MLAFYGVQFQFIAKIDILYVSYLFCREDLSSTIGFIKCSAIVTLRCHQKQSEGFLKCLKFVNVPDTQR